MDRSLSLQDIIIAYSHPYDLNIGVPGCKDFRFFNYILARLASTKKEKVSAISKEIGRDEEYILKKITPSLIENKIIYFNEKTEELTFNGKYSESWEYSKGLFRHICEKLFKEKDPSSLTYQKIEVIR